MYMSVLWPSLLFVTPFETPEVVPDWQETHAMHTLAHRSSFGKWIRTDLGVRTFQGLGKNSPPRTQVIRRITRDLHTEHILEYLSCDSHLQVPLHRQCLPDCGPTTSHTRDIETTFVHRLFPRFYGATVPHEELPPSRFPSGGGFRLPFQTPFQSLMQFMCQSAALLERRPCC